MKKTINSVLPFTVGGSESSKSSGVVKTGFIVGYESGHIQVFMKSDTKEFYKRSEPEKDDLMMLNEYERSENMMK